MKQIAAYALALLLATPLHAQDEDPPIAPMPDVENEGESLGDTARDLFDGFREEVEPDLRDLAEQLEPSLRRFARQMGPMLSELQDMIGDVSNYELPEKLPNGDIILRYKDPGEDGDAPEPGPEDEGTAGPGETIDL
ncbi:hypothetical protein [Tropicimonas sp. IMCC34011]|uniref:hypothetical protein n=1 Tax=Tropicimonas sp. IMCC34011 TaxID=2248759 RepID=UPI000E25AE07|nr:hypothetical protein [Tropicimonas sp. IMCC34011]